MKRKKLSIKEQKESYENAIICDICKEIVKNKHLKDKKLSLSQKSHCHYKGEYKGAVHSKSDFKYSVPKKIPKVFHNKTMIIILS